MKINQGFTLVEVLISAVILFSALAVAAEIFKVSSYSADKASASARLYQINPVAISAIKGQLKEQQKKNSNSHFEGSLTIFGIEYDWLAQRISYLPPTVYEGDVGNQKPRFGLYIVNVTAKQSSKQQTYTFEVATW